MNIYLIGITCLLIMMVTRIILAAKAHSAASNPEHGQLVNEEERDLRTVADTIRFRSRLNGAR